MDFDDHPLIIDKARCLAFETALNAEVVADVLKPPTYAYGAYGSWMRKPV